MTKPDTNTAFHLDVAFFENEAEDLQTQFTSISGLTVDLDIEKLTERGETNFKHSFPSRKKFPNLVLKNGLIKNKKVITWCKDAIENKKLSPIDVHIKLMNQTTNILAYNIIHAYPVKWKIKGSKYTDKNLAVKSVELAYNYFKLV